MRGAGAAAAFAAAGLALVAAARGPARAQYPSDHVHQRHFEVQAPDGPQRVLITFPRRDDGRDYPADHRLPLVVALHGAAEARRGPQRGALGWNVDYRLPDAFAALLRGRLARADYRGLVTNAHLRYVNEMLRVRPFRGVCVVTPYTPDLLDQQPGSDSLRRWSDWVAGPFLQQVRAQHPFVAQTRAGTAIAGVSLGGMLALDAGLAHPQAFALVVAIQPAITARVPALAAKASQTRTPPELVLITSTGDHFLAPTRELSTHLRARGISHITEEMPGPHDYVFNRGPGALEMLRLADAELAREPLAP